MEQFFSRHRIIAFTVGGIFFLFAVYGMVFAFSGHNHSPAARYVIGSLFFLFLSVSLFKIALSQQSHL